MWQANNFPAQGSRTRIGGRMAIPKEYSYTICHVTIRRGDHIIFNEYVFLNPSETPQNPDETPEVVIRYFQMLQQNFSGLYGATIAATTRIHTSGSQIKAQRLRGFDYVLHKCPTHADEKGAWCRKCGTQLFRIVVVNNLNHYKRGSTR